MRFSTGLLSVNVSRGQQVEKKKTVGFHVFLLLNLAKVKTEAKCYQCGEERVDHQSLPSSALRFSADSPLSSS